MNSIKSIDCIFGVLALMSFTALGIFYPLLMMTLLILFPTEVSNTIEAINRLLSSFLMRPRATRASVRLLTVRDASINEKPIEIAGVHEGRLNWRTGKKDRP